MAYTASGRAQNGRGASSRAAVSSRSKNNVSFNKDAVCIAFVIAAILFFLILVWPKSEFSPLSSFYRFFTGLFGSMFWSLPIVCALGSFFAYRSMGDKRVFLKSVFTVSAIYVLLLTAVEAFHVNDITKTMEISDSYMNFLSFAYRANIGGGALGALLAWPFYSFMGKWGALLICLFLSVLILFAVGAFSLDAVMTQIGNLTAHSGGKAQPETAPSSNKAPARRSEAASKKPQPPRMPVKNAPAAKRTAPSAERDVFDVKPSARRKPASSYAHEASFADDYGINTAAPVRLPNLKGSSAPSRKPLRNDDDGFEIPKVHPDERDPYEEFFEKPVRRKPAGKPAAKSPETKKTSAKAPSIEKIDLMEAVKSESPEERNRKYVKSALSDHSKAPKPVLSYSAPKPAAKKANPVETETDAGSGYEAAPKPSVKIAPVKPVSEAHVLPKEEKRAPAAPAAEKPAPEAAARKEPPAPKASFFDSPVPEKKEEYVPKTTLAGMKKEVSEEYDFPPIDLMETGGVQYDKDNYEAGDMQRAEKLVETLRSFSVPVKITGISHGPAVTRFELLPAPGIKVSKIASYADDIAMNLAAESVRIEAPIPGKSAVGVELPNLKKEIVHLRDVLESAEARKAASRLAVALGKDNSGKYIVADLASMPHVLIAGQTGSGKSVCINAIIISILYRATPEEVRMIMIDPKMVELNAYNTIPHLLVPVVTDPKKAASALDWAVSEMTRRYKEFAAHGAKNIQSYNKKLPEGEKPMPQIVIIVDELADLMMTAPHDVEEAINRLAQLARAAGMHLVIATQRPSVNVITGVIKANIPTRIAFTVASGVDSRTILDSYGAESLLGKGDMLYLPPDRNKPLRIQGAWVSEGEVQEVVDYISSTHETNFDEDILEHMENAVLSDAEKSDKQKEEADDQVDELFPIAVKAVMDAGQASISMLQRKLRVGYARAGRLIDDMASRGLVSQSEGSKSREVLITREQYYELFGDAGDDYN